MPWAEVLDQFEHGADACEQYFLRGDRGTPPALVDLSDVPADLGPLPEHLASRARAVLRRMDNVQAQLARVPRPAASSGRTRFAGASAPAAVSVDRAI